ncbi:hypothetical protein XI25_15025 [Paenibacillus sp. DMB20]|nr:hypothetical protein XI25_15025 [Paenibacillus sp. DMB20]
MLTPSEAFFRPVFDVFGSTRYFIGHVHGSLPYAGHHIAAAFIDGRHDIRGFAAYRLGKLGRFLADDARNLFGFVRDQRELVRQVPAKLASRLRRKQQSCRCTGKGADKYAFKKTSNCFVPDILVLIDS